MNAPAEMLRFTPELLLDVFDAPVSFHRCLVPLTGGVTAALMLSQAICTTQTLDAMDDGWFQKSQEQWMDETGLSRSEQETARRALREAGLMEERRVGMPSRLWYRVCARTLWQALRRQSERTRSPPRATT